MAAEACTPSHEQARLLRKMSEDGTLTDAELEELMQQPKPNQVEMFRFPAARLSGLVPQGATRDEIEERVIQGLKLLRRYEDTRAARSS